MNSWEKTLQLMGTWLDNPLEVLSGRPEGTLFALQTRLGYVMMCVLGKHDDRGDLIATRMTDLKFVNISRLMPKTKVLLWQSADAAIDVVVEVFDMPSRPSNLSELRSACERHAGNGIHSCHPSCSRPACVARRERDEARRIAEEACVKLAEHGIGLEHPPMPWDNQRKPTT